MRSPWQVWLAFAVCLAMIVAAVGWLSFRALESDRAEATAKQQAAAEESARLALWRIDSKLAPLVTQESARPYFSYSTFFPVERSPAAKGRTKMSAPEPIPSPLVAAPPPEILLHFQIDAAGHFSSPRVPPEELRGRAVPRFLTAEDATESKRLLDHVKTFVDRTKLLATLPPPELPAPTQIAANNFNGSIWPKRRRGGMARARETRSTPPITMAIATVTTRTTRRPISRFSSLADSKRSHRSRWPSSLPPIPTRIIHKLKAISNRRCSASSAAGNDYQQRSQYLAQNMANAPPQNDLLNWTDTPGDERTAMMTPLWIGDQLILARRVAVGGKELIQVACSIGRPSIGNCERRWPICCPRQSCRRSPCRARRTRAGDRPCCRCGSRSGRCRNCSISRSRRCGCRSLWLGVRCSSERSPWPCCSKA